MNVSFLGLGNMSRVIIHALFKDGSLREGDISVYNRTEEKAKAFQSRYPGIHCRSSIAEAVQGSDIVVIGVRSHAVRDVVSEAVPSMMSNAHLVALNGGVSIRNLETLYCGPITKMIPAVTLEAGRGVTLVCHNEKVTTTQRNAITDLFGRSSTVKTIDEGQFEVAGDLTSCAPALIAEMMGKFAEAGVRHGDISPEDALEMVLETMAGTAALLTEHKVSIEELKSRVATKGGITEQGLKVLDRELPRVFDQVMEATTAKHEMVKKEISARYESR